MTYRFHHVHLICKNLEQMITFFTDVLHAKLISRQKFGTADGASLDLHGTTINLRVSREDEKMVGDASKSRYGFDHIGLEVEDVDAAYRDLTERGFSFFTPPKDTKTPGLLSLKDPKILPSNWCSREVDLAVGSGSVKEAVSKYCNISEGSEGLGS